MSFEHWVLSKSFPLQSFAYGHRWPFSLLAFWIDSIESLSSVRRGPIGSNADYGSGRVWSGCGRRHTCEHSRAGWPARSVRGRCPAGTSCGPGFRRRWKRQSGCKAGPGAVFSELLRRPRQEDHVQRWLRAMERGGRYGVYFIFKRMEQGPTFRCAMPTVSTRSKTPITASWLPNGAASRTTTSTFATRC